MLMQITENQKMSLGFRDDAIKNYTEKIVEEIICNPSPEFDESHQSPERRHPVFRAMQATRTCCRACLLKYHKIPKARELELHEIDSIVNRLVLWMEQSSF